MTKTIKVLLIVLLTLMIAALIFIMVFVMKNGFVDLGMSDNDMKLVDSFEATVMETEKIYLDLDSADVKITDADADTDKITVKYYSNYDSSVTIENVGGTVSVDEAKSDKPKNFFHLKKRVEISVSEAFTGEYRIVGKSSDVYAENDLTNNVVIISLNSGDVALASAGNLFVNTDSGDVTVDKINKKTVIMTSSGDAAINKADLKGASEISALSGDIVISELNMKENVSITTSSGDVTVRKNLSRCYVETDTSSGSVSVDKGDRKSDIVLTVTTSSGDIFVH
ncbi:MAG: DUF4097 domain-containing protein [Clostridiales bacterium]|nr:DUF4097 domain-containing protein [Clostridiales bacterium]